MRPMGAKALGALAAAVVATFGLAGGAAAQAVDLFRPATETERAAQADPRPGRMEKRSRIVSLNADPLASSELRIALFPGAVATVRRTDARDADEDRSVWNGEGKNASATLVVEGGRITGLVRLKGRSYRIKPAGGRAHRIVELDPSRIPPDGPLRPAPKRPERKASDAAAPAAGASKSEIRVLVAYTAKAAAASADIAGDARLAVELANKAYKAGGVKIRMKLTGATPVPGFVEPSSDAFDAALDGATAGTGAFAATAARRDADAADLVAVFIDDPQYCGLGWYVGEPTTGDAGFGFSVVAHDCVAYHTFAHEAGHNMGLHHDRYVEEKAPKSAYNFGFVNVKKRKRDIMSYNDRCADRGLTCERVNRFSDPSVKVDGQPFGVKRGEKGAADAVRRLNETRVAIEAYR